MAGRALVEAIQFPVEHPKEYNPYTLSTPWASGACLLITKEIFEELGGFDEEFFMYCEDVDLSWRCRASGIPVKLCPTALFLHAVPNRTMSARTLHSIYQSGLILARKWGAPTAFSDQLRGALCADGRSPQDLRSKRVPETWQKVADFDHDFTFAIPRW